MLILISDEEDIIFFSGVKNDNPIFKHSLEHLDKNLS